MTLLLSQRRAAWLRGEHRELVAFVILPLVGMLLVKRTSGKVVP
jgi:hypothetical protein